MQSIGPCGLELYPIPIAQAVLLPIKITVAGNPFTKEIKSYDRFGSKLWHRRPSEAANSLLICGKPARATSIAALRRKHTSGQINF